MIRRRFSPFPQLSPPSHLVLLVLAGLAACSGSATEQTLGIVLEKRAATPGGLVARLLTGEWRLYSGAFGSSARDGHEVEFAFDGFVHHDQRRLGDVWSMEATDAEECTLVVYPSSATGSEVSLEFTYDPEHDAFVFDRSLAHMVMAPAGFDFRAYLARR